MSGLGMAPKEILSRLFNPFNLKILDLYLETWLWSPLICAEKALNGRVDIWDYVKTYFQQFCLFLTFFWCFYHHSHIVIFISLYIILSIIIIN